MFDWISESLTEMLIRFNLIKEEDYGDVEYVVLNIVYNFAVIVSLLLSGWYFNCIMDTIIISIVFNIFRVFVGGKHASTLGRCFIITAFIIPMATFASKYLHDYSEIVAPIASASILVLILKALEK